MHPLTTPRRVLVANRGEIAMRVMRTCADMGIETVAVHSPDDASCLHVRHANAVAVLPGQGPAGYLNMEAVVAAAKEHGADAVHPGYGFLSESAEFAEHVRTHGMMFIGPSTEILRTFGDKTAARAAAERAGLPLARATGPASLDDARDFLRSLGDGGAVMVKAVSGGGGRGIRPVFGLDQLDDAYARCASEAERAFGSSAVYLEQLVRDARHVEVQVVGDGRVASHLWERDCSVQRQRQKVVEVAPSPQLDDQVRGRLLDSAVALATAEGFDTIGTMEFLVGADDQVVFMEMNPRLQVEHTVTEQITGVDLVRTQILLATGASLYDLGLTTPPPVRGSAIQLRVNGERVGPDGRVAASGGKLCRVQLPAGPGVRVDSHAYDGYAPNLRFDSLLAKLVVHIEDGSWTDLLRKAGRALAETALDGVETNLSVLVDVLTSPEVIDARFDTALLDRMLAQPLPGRAVRPRYFAADVAGERTETDPVVDYDGAGAEVRSPLTGTVLSVEVAESDTVTPGTALVLLESMKMEYTVAATAIGRVDRLAVGVGDTVLADQPLLWILEDQEQDAAAAIPEEMDLDHIRPELADIEWRRAHRLDEARPELVAKHRAMGHQTARENVEQLFDEDSFLEIGSLVLAAQEYRRTEEWLVENSTGDGVVAGFGTVNAAEFGVEAAQVAVMAYDYTVFAGTQGIRGHAKLDRLIQMVKHRGTPLVLFTEGGGGRPGDVFDEPMLGRSSFQYLADLTGKVPVVGINAGPSFAGNAAILGMCDVIIATRDSNLGMGGPSMIEGGGLGVVRKEDIGPAPEQHANGVIDILVDDEAEAIEVAKKYLSYFQGSVSDYEAGDQRVLRHILPEKRVRVYQPLDVLRGFADLGSVMELRAAYGLTVITALVRVEGRPIGVIINNPQQLGGAIDSEGADKAVDFLRLCNAFGLPMISLIDTPGFMIGPASDGEGAVRRLSRMFISTTQYQPPWLVVVLRKAYGLGAVAMAGPGIAHTRMTVSWPTGEFGPMGLEALVRLGYKRELEAIESLEERERRFAQLVAEQYEIGKITRTAAKFHIDEVIDPADTRRWITESLRGHQPPSRKSTPGERSPSHGQGSR